MKRLFFLLICSRIANIVLALQMLKPQDVLVACKIFSLGESKWIFSRLAGSLEISVSETHGATERCKKAGILGTPRGKLTVARKRFFELLTLAVPQVFYAVRGAVGHGVPTSVWADPLDKWFPVTTREIGGIPLVWPHLTGTMKGESLLPIYPTVPRIVQHDDVLYKMLALVDVIRTAEISERKLATDLLEKMILKDERR